MTDYHFWSASKMIKMIKSKEISSEELISHCLNRIDQVNPKINAVVQIAADRAIAEARQCDQMAARNEYVGPLHGVPITLKDSIDTEGIVSTGGTMGRKDFIPDRDAPVAARLRAAGAVLLGKTNTPELTLSGETNNLIYGRTNNPFDLNRSPGGSSGGSAAIIAAGGSALDLGSDTGGSIREPAHLCGITGIKPTSGRTPRTGHIVPFTGGVMDSLTQIGPMARTVEDLELTLPLICGLDGIDPHVVPVPVNSAKAVDLKSLRIAWYNHNTVVAPCYDVMRVVTNVAEVLQAAGFMIEEAIIPGIHQLVSLSTELRESVNSGLILRLLEKYGTKEPGPDLERYFTDQGLANMNRVDPQLIEKIDQAKSDALQIFTQYDVILCPPSHAIARTHRSSHGDTFNDWSYITIQNLLGWPSATVRAGTSESGNLPVGVQVVAAPWREDVVLALLGEIERRFGGFQPPEI